MSGLLAMGVGGQQMDGQPVPQAGDALGNAIHQNPVQCQRAVDVGDQVLEPQGIPAREW